MSVDGAYEWYDCGSDSAVKCAEVSGGKVVSASAELNAARTVSGAYESGSTSKPGDDLTYTGSKVCLAAGRSGSVLYGACSVGEFGLGSGPPGGDGIGSMPTVVEYMDSAE